MNYQQAWGYLDDLQFHKIKLGLEAMHSFMAEVGNPERGLRVVHVAGTNGKGSVSMTLVTILAAAGYRVGLYTSPHLSSVRERFRVNDRFITEEKFAELATRIRQVLGPNKITYFEFTTALAFLWFAEEGLDLVVLETGLGGRLDATNIVLPLVSVITNVSMDHEAYLGDSIASVATEKAGIVKEGIPVVSAVKEEGGLYEVKAACRSKKAPLFLYGQQFSASPQGGGEWRWSASADWSGITYPALRCAMKGDYQIENASLALAAIELLKAEGLAATEGDIRQGLATVHWPGRLEYVCLDRESREQLKGGGAQGTVSYLLDGAHNPAGVSSLVHTLERECSYGALIIVWGAMADKDLEQTLSLVAELGSTIILTTPAGERSATPELLLASVPGHLRDRCLLSGSVDMALRKAESQALPGDLILVAGSLYLIGAARQLLLGELVP